MIKLAARALQLPNPKDYVLQSIADGPAFATAVGGSLNKPFTLEKAMSFSEDLPDLSNPAIFRLELEALQTACSFF